MHKIEITPVPCTGCGMGNTPNGDGTRREFVDFERDVNWNDPVIFCDACLMQAGALVGMVSPDTLASLRQELRDKDRALHEAKADMDKMRRRAKKIGVEFAT